MNYSILVFQNQQGSRCMCPQNMESAHYFSNIRVMVLLIRVFDEVCVPPLMWTKWRVDSLWMLISIDHFEIGCMEIFFSSLVNDMHHALLLSRLVRRNFICNIVVSSKFTCNIFICCFYLYFCCQLKKLHAIFVVVIFGQGSSIAKKLYTPATFFSVCCLKS